MQRETGEGGEAGAVVLEVGVHLAGSGRACRHATGPAKAPPRMPASMTQGEGMGDAGGKMRPSRRWSVPSGKARRFIGNTTFEKP